MEKKDVDQFIEYLREIEDRFGITKGYLMAFDDLPIRKGDKVIRNILGWLFHKFLIRIQNHLVDDFYLKGGTKVWTKKN